MYLLARISCKLLQLAKACAAEKADAWMYTSIYSIDQDLHACCWMETKEEDKAEGKGDRGVAKGSRKLDG